ncbi:hypothetical protein BDA99DRAFT_561987 [Phascolomyces articulosus]|uniref:Mso1 N-terminal domain-containing protein n=1 Tax=Phascolomyces articulosus TaxID=60185 RepID=A0AAD5JVW2_9FUNG|nr:hypothetical protein BDA99DRAFT_561987 [Phascolomyces articulosus]
MGAQAVDYRVSKVVVCCKDCGQDVGLYPARHKCQEVVRPPLPPLPTKFTAEDPSNLRVPRKPVPSYDNNENNRSRPTSAASSNSSSTLNQLATSDTSSATSTGSKWSRFVRSPSNNNIKNNTTTNSNNGGDNDDDSFYYNNFAAHLPDQSSDSGSSPSQSGKKLWGKVRQNEKWKQLNEKYDKPKQSAKLWGKLVQATQNMADKIPSRDDRGPESDESDWEGETHVSRVLREHYEKKHEPLPRWLYDERAPRQQPSKMMHRQSMEENDSMLPPLDRQGARGRKKLWDAHPEPQMSQREREREELRQQRRAPLMDNNNNNAYEYNDHSSRQQRRTGASHLEVGSSRHGPMETDAYHDRNSRRTAPSMEHDYYEDRHATRSATYRRPDRHDNDLYDESATTTTRSATTYRRPQENDGGGWKMSSRNKNPVAGSMRQQEKPSRYNMDHDDYGSSRSYLSDRHVPASARARSPGRSNNHDISPSTSSDYYASRYDNSASRDRVRGPRDIPQQFSNRYTERGGGYF